MTDAALNKKLGAMPEWDLSDLYNSPEDKQLHEDIAVLLEKAVQFQKDYSGKITLYGGKGDAEKLLEAIKSYEALGDLSGRIGTYAQLLYASNNELAENKKLYGDVSDQLTKAGTGLLFFELELNKLTDEQLEKLYQSCDGLKNYKPWLDNLRFEKDHQLDEPIEKLFHEKSATGRTAWFRLFQETFTQMRFDVEGADEPLSLEPTLNLLQSPDEAKRKAASDGLAKGFGDKIQLFAHITNVLAKDKEISDRWRGFKSVADSRHLSNRVEPEVVNALVDAVTSSYENLSHRYYKLKAKWLGKAQMETWDRNAPLPFENNQIIPFARAKDMVLSAYHGFSPKVGSIVEQFFDQNWIDAPVRKGKQQGAFSHPSVPSSHPFILMNYMGRARCVQTLAHELGHGVHQYLAADQGALMCRTPLTLAETASVFGEMLTFQNLLANCDNETEKKALLAGKVEDMLNTVVRQIAFYNFEVKVHEGRRKGELTIDQINNFWLQTQKASFGDAIAIKEGYENFWTYIPHFIHTPFYVYSYAFGDCLVNSLYAVYKPADESFITRYLDLLKAGGAKPYHALLAPFGLDAKDPHFWQGGLKVISDMIDKLEEGAAST